MKQKKTEKENKIEIKETDEENKVYKDFDIPSSESIKNLPEGENIDEATKVKSIKRKYKRKQPPIEYSKESIKALIDGIFKTISVKAGSHWQLNESELDLLTECSYNVAICWLPEISDKQMSLIALGGSLLIVVLPRLAMSKKKPKNEQETNTTSTE